MTSQFWLTPRLMSLLQGLYYTPTGIWPLISMETFLAVTGPKTDLWLVRTVGLLVTVIGLVLLMAARSPQVGGPVITLGVGSALALAWVDAYYSLTGVIWPVYLLDAFGEVALFIGWCLALAFRADAKFTLENSVRSNQRATRSKRFVTCLSIE